MSHKRFITKEINKQQYNIINLPGSNIFKFEIVTGIGAHLERSMNDRFGKVWFGGSHLVEHLGFRQPRDYSSIEVKKGLRALGTYNASTGSAHLRYWSRTTTDHINESIKLVCNVAFNDLTGISEEEFQAEKSVVMNELSMYADDPQTMFRYGTRPVITGGKHEDNVLGTQSTVGELSLDDVINIKRIMTTHPYVINITYDDSKVGIDSIIESIEHQSDRFQLDSTGEILLGIDEYQNDIMIRIPVLGDHILEFPELDQYMTTIILPNTSYPVNVVDMGMGFIGEHSPSSLSQLIREEHGLTYGIHSYYSTFQHQPYPTISTDVGMKNIELLHDLIQRSTSESVNLFVREQFDQMIETQCISETINRLNLMQYEQWFSVKEQFPEFFAKYEGELALDMDHVDDMILYENGLFEQVYAFIKEYSLNISLHHWSKVSTHE